MGTETTHSAEPEPRRQSIALILTLLLSLGSCAVALWVLVLVASESGDAMILAMVAQIVEHVISGPVLGICAWTYWMRYGRRNRRTLTVVAVLALVTPAHEALAAVGAFDAEGQGQFLGLSAFFGLVMLGWAAIQVLVLTFLLYALHSRAVREWMSTRDDFADGADF